MFGLIVLLKKVENLREIKAHVLIQTALCNSKHIMYLHTTYTVAGHKDNVGVLVTGPDAMISKNKRIAFFVQYIYS
jgi:hypothetical protein